MVAALVRPVTYPWECRMVPAPMKPTPVRIWAAMRPGSPVPAPIWIERCVKVAAPMQMRMFVRRPAGLPFSSRSRPMIPPEQRGQGELEEQVGVQEARELGGAHERARRRRTSAIAPCRARPSRHSDRGSVSNRKRLFSPSSRKFPTTATKAILKHRKPASSRWRAIQAAAGPAPERGGEADAEHDAAGRGSAPSSAPARADRRRSPGRAGVRRTTHS